MALAEPLVLPSAGNIETKRVAAQEGTHVIDLHTASIHYVCVVSLSFSHAFFAMFPFSYLSKRICVLYFPPFLLWLQGNDQVVGQPLPVIAVTCLGSSATWF